MTNDESSIGGVPSIAPAVADEPVFREPWEAQAFAMTVLLHQRGLFTWAEWAQALGAQIARATMSGPAGTWPRRVDANPVDKTPYYQHWLAALETLVAAKGASSPDELTRLQRAWQHAAHRTPHGQSVDLQSQDLEG
jgi:nitrile hydratase accessory protein